jgi:hypothetical protein
MRILIDIFNKKDITLLLKKPDDSYPLEDLRIVLDNIMVEYESLSGENNYSMFYQIEGMKEWENYRLKAIELAIKGLELGFKEDVQRLIDAFKFKVALSKKLIDRAAINKLTLLYKSIKNRQKVKKANEDEKKQKEGDVAIVWEDKMSFIHRVLDRLPKYNCSVALYLSYEKQANAVLKAKEKH